LESLPHIIIAGPAAKAEDRTSRLAALVSQYYPELGPMRYARHDQAAPQLFLGATQIGLSIAHTDAMEVIALSTHRQIGIDLERLDRSFPVDKLVGRYWSPGEQASLALLTGEDRRASALAQWVRREAMVKAKGTGLAGNLHEYEPLEDLADGKASYQSMVMGPYLMGVAWRGRQAMMVVHSK
tara:strand:- start:400 stop:948 length:549 start_codon:yes stop_codon:yes gene_type:complete